MSCLGYFSGSSPVHRLDPRVRLIGAAWLAVCTALVRNTVVLGWSLAFAMGLATAARLKWRALACRLWHVNAFMVFLWLVLPWSVPGSPLCTVGGLECSREGVRFALMATLKGNAMVLFFTALVATISPQRLPAALGSLGIPQKAVHLLALTVRYVDLIHEQYVRLKRAMRARAFEPRFSRHTLRTWGYLVGLLLLRGMERAERVLAAMKCRGFDGRYLTLETWTFGCAEVTFLALVSVQTVAWFWYEWP